MSERLRVIVAEDDYLVREGTRRLLEDGGEAEVLASVADAKELVKAVRQLRPDAVLTDIRMPPSHRMEGIEAAHRIRHDQPGVGVVVLSQHADQAYAHELFKNGTAGLAYLLKERILDRAQLLQALREVAAGRSVVDPQIVELLLRRGRGAPGLDELTAREREVLQQMAQGKTNAAIAETLHLSIAAVEKHASAIFSKLGLTQEPQVHRRVAAVLSYLGGNR